MEIEKKNGNYGLDEGTTRREGFVRRSRGKRCVLGASRIERRTAKGTRESNVISTKGILVWVRVKAARKTLLQYPRERLLIVDATVLRHSISVMVPYL